MKVNPPGGFPLLSPNCQPYHTVTFDGVPNAVAVNVCEPPSPRSLQPAGEMLTLGVISGLNALPYGFNLLAVPDYWQDIVRGILIILAVALSFAVDRRGT